MISSPDADLLQAYLDGRLASAEVMALNERLLREPALADALVSLAREEAILSEWARSARVAESTAVEKRAVSALLPAAVIARPTFPSWPQFAHPRRAAALLVATAAAFLITVLAISLKQHGKIGEPAFLANLEEVQGNVFIVTPTGLSIPARQGQRLFAEQELRTSGEGSFAVIQYEDRTRLEMSPDTLIRLLGEAAPGTKQKRGRGKKVFLNEGVLAAEVVEQPEGFPMVVTTPHAVLEVRESTFSSSSAKDATRIELDGGRLQFTRRSDGKSIEVATGSYAVASAPAEAFAPHPLPVRVKKPRAIFKETSGPVLSLAYSPDGKTVAIGCRDGSIRLCDAETGTERAVRTGNKKVSSAVFARSGKTLAALVDDRTVKLWDVATLKEQKRFAHRKLKFTCMAFSSDGKTLAAGCGDRSVRLWDTVAGLEEAVLRDGDSEVLGMAFSPDGKTLAVGGGRGQELGQVSLWDVATRRKRETLVGHSGLVRAVAFSADGQTLASASDDGTVRLWDGRTGQARSTLKGHARRVLSVALSPDGLRLASAGNDNTARLWDLATGKEKAVFKAGKHRTSCVAFSPDGKVLATGGWDRTVRLWDITVKEIPSADGFND